MVPIKNVLLFKEISYETLITLFIFFATFPLFFFFAGILGPRALPCTVQCKLIPAGPRVILSDPSELFIVWYCRSLLLLLLYAK